MARKRDEDMIRVHFDRVMGKISDRTGALRNFAPLTEAERQIVRFAIMDLANVAGVDLAKGEVIN